MTDAKGGISPGFPPSQGFAHALFLGAPPDRLDRAKEALLFHAQQMAEKSPDLSFEIWMGAMACGEMARRKRESGDG